MVLAAGSLPQCCVEMCVLFLCSRFGSWAAGVGAAPRPDTQIFTSASSWGAEAVGLTCWAFPVPEVLGGAWQAQITLVMELVSL